MKIRDDIAVFDAVGEGISLFVKHIKHVLFVLVLEVICFYGLNVILDVMGFIGFVMYIPLFVCGVFLNISLIEAIKGTYEKEPNNMFQAMKSSLKYLGAAVTAMLLSGVGILLIVVVVGLVSMILGAIFGPWALVGILAMLLLVFIFMFILQGIVIGELNASEAILFSFEIFKNNFLKFIGILLGVFLFNVILDFFIKTIFFEDTKIFHFIDMVQGYVFGILGLFISTVMFYQVTLAQIKQNESVLND